MMSVSQYPGRFIKLLSPSKFCRHHLNHDDEVEINLPRSLQEMAMEKQFYSLLPSNISLRNDQKLLKLRI